MLPSFFVVSICSFLKFLHMRCGPTLPKVPAILHLVIDGFSSICKRKVGQLMDINYMYLYL